MTFYGQEIQKSIEWETNLWSIHTHGLQMGMVLTGFPSIFPVAKQPKSDITAMRQKISELCASDRPN